MERVLTDENLAATLTRRGAARAERYTWDRAADGLATVIQDVAG
jgi:glycosyltransferase involved in cell wall biosynthesis